MSETGAKINELKQSIAKKKDQVREVVQNFSQIHSELKSIKQTFEKERQSQSPLLAELKEESEDTRLSHMFAQQSRAMRRQGRKGKEPLHLGHLKKQG